MWIRANNHRWSKPHPNKIRAVAKEVGLTEKMIRIILWAYLCTNSLYFYKYRVIPLKENHVGIKFFINEFQKKQQTILFDGKSKKHNNKLYDCGNIRRYRSENWENYFPKCSSRIEQAIENSKINFSTFRPIYVKYRMWVTKNSIWIF